MREKVEDGELAALRSEVSQHDWEEEEEERGGVGAVGMVYLVA